MKNTKFLGVIIFKKYIYIFCKLMRAHQGSASCSSWLSWEESESRLELRPEEPVARGNPNSPWEKNNIF